jgi:hypothetical protein
MPFLDGISCSIHGMVFEGHVAVFRPCEMLVFRDRPGLRFVYGRAGTFWDPPQVLTAEMRAVARAVGAELRRRADYRGAFTVDGVATEDGFRPTELNARFGAALNRLTAAHPDLPLFLINAAIVAGAVTDGPGGLDVAAFERWVLEGAEAHRAGSAFVITDRPPPSDDASLQVTVDDFGEVTPVPGTGPASDEEVVAEVTWSAVGQGGRVSINFGPATPVGPPLGPLAVRILEVCDRHWGLGLPPLEAPDPVG